MMTCDMKLCNKNSTYQCGIYVDYIDGKLKKRTARWCEVHSTAKFNHIVFADDTVRAIWQYTHQRWSNV